MTRTMLSVHRALISAILLASLALTLRPFSAASVAIQSSEYASAVALVQQGQFDKAIPILEQLIAKSPEDLKARNLLGITLSAAGRREEANEQFRKIIAADPKFAPALKNLAVNELALGRTQEAASHFKAALALAPQDPACHWGLGEIAFGAGDYPNAAAHYDQSGELALKDPRVAVRFATACAETNKPSRAAAILERLPTDIDATTHFQAGLVLAKLDRFDDAARHFELALTGYPDRYQAGFNLLLMLVRKGDHTAAIKTGEDLLARGYRRGEVFNLLAQAYEEGGKAKEAYDALRAAVELEPQDEINYLDLVILCLDQDNYDQGLEIADIGVLRIPRSARLHLQRGVVLAMKSRFDDARKEFESSTELSPEAGLPQVALGFVLIQVEKFSEAIELLRAQSVKSPNDPYVFWFLGEALNRSGASIGSAQEQEALAALQKSVQLDPQLPQPRALLGKMLLRRGEITRAVEQLEKALELDPNDMTATYQLALALQKKGDGERAKELFARVEKAKSGGQTAAQRDLRWLVKSRRK